MRSIILAAGLGAVGAANALLMVPDVPPSGNDLVGLVPIEALAGRQSRSVSLACPSCPFGDSAVGIQSNIPNHLQLDFSVEPTTTAGGSSDRLLLNGFELYPHRSWSGPLRAIQVAHASSDKADLSEVDSALPELGYSVAVRPVAAEEDGSAELLEIKFQVLQVGRLFVDEVAPVMARVIKQDDGTLVIVSVETQEVPPHTSLTHLNPPTQCQTALCRLHEQISQQLGALRSGMHKHCGGAGRTKHAGQPSSQHRPGRQGTKNHDRRRILRNVAVNILLSVTIAVVAAVTSSIVGMIIGSFVVCLWRVVIRQPGPSHRTQHRSRRSSTRGQQAALGDEKRGLMAAYVDDDDKSSGEDSV